jgi:hypothetical protein
MVRLTGAGGRGVVAPWEVAPQADMASALTASIPIVVLLHILESSSETTLGPGVAACAGPVANPSEGNTRPQERNTK